MMLGLKKCLSGKDYTVITIITVAVIATLLRLNPSTCIKRTGVIAFICNPALCCQRQEGHWGKPTPCFSEKLQRTKHAYGHVQSQSFWRQAQEYRQLKLAGCQSSYSFNKMPYFEEIRWSVIQKDIFFCLLCLYLHKHVDIYNTHTTFTHRHSPNTK